eukprot:CAMPEP_0174825920 /NCGR_PEP_ID=MMETSP1107-20130205/43266_1 /TAXON_ID=36770 /ORGANISM="Paraphysomonas vestita, Strain GFlagA" /LENGTH=838 /DNA_ID=CAMNT_0016058065 /DNA_START=1649 /DNA_END=4165 /DNA_ORIENTATION=-
MKVIENMMKEEGIMEEEEEEEIIMVEVIEEDQEVEAEVEAEVEVEVMKVIVEEKGGMEEMEEIEEKDKIIIHMIVNYDDDRGRNRKEQINGDTGKDNSNWNDQDKAAPPAPTTPTVMIKGLPSHTTEPVLYAVLAPYGPQSIRLIAQRETGECKGFAFVEFYTMEHAQYFMATFAGSSGGNFNAPQLIVENRAVTLEYAREPAGGHGSHRNTGNDSNSSKKDHHPIKRDWLCDSCGYQNFARRVLCYRCSLPKGENSVSVTIASSSDPYADAVIVSTIPCATLAVRSIPIFTTEDQITEVFRQFAPVKSVFLVRDLTTGLSRGIAFVEFFSVEYSTYVLSNSSTLQFDRTTPTINYAKESFVQNLPAFHQQQLMLTQYAGAAAAYNSTPNTGYSHAQHHAYATAALQAAQWSSSYNSQYPQQQQQQMSQYPYSTISTTVTSTNTVPKVKTNWPLVFETNGASYIYQTQTGLFYDTVQKYYYCTKSKLYYNEADGTYLSQAPPGSEVPFVLFEPPEPSTLPSEEVLSVEKSSVNSITTTSINSESSNKLNTRKPVVLSMNLSNSSKAKITKPNEKKSDSSNETEIVTPVVVLTSMKKFSQDIAKWGERKHELESIEQTYQEQSQQQKAVTNDSTNNIEIQINNNSSVSNSNGTICTLCRRQFNSPEQLQRHERESKLHADNLAKLKASQQQQQPSNPSSSSSSSPPSLSSLEQQQQQQTIYRDRASERRAIHGQSEIPDDSEFGRKDEIFSGSKRRAGSVTDYLVDNSSVINTTLPTTLIEDGNNPGNQLLRRMGWNEGEGLGKDSSGRVESIAESANIVAAAGRGQTKVGVGLVDYHK